LVNTDIDYYAMFQVALEEAHKGWAEGGVPIGAALFDSDGRLLGKAAIEECKKAIPLCMPRLMRFEKPDACEAIVIRLS
jgi:tRNA(Arg) A34 adenosine deaminase TadA